MAHGHLAFIAMILQAFLKANKYIVTVYSMFCDRYIDNVF